MTLEEVACPADPRTGDVWTAKVWVCPNDEKHNEPYEPEPVEMDDDS